MPSNKMPPNFKQAVANVNRLTLAFAKAVAARQSDKNDNLVVAPYNALTCLSMVAKGAAKMTREEMARTLFGTDAAHLEQEVENLVQLNAAVLEANKGQVELKTANGVWANKELLQLDPEYVAALQRQFGAEVANENFSDPAVPGKINQWASDNTNKLIDNIIGQLNANDLAVLASALYFKGKWTSVFDKKLTEDRTFTSDGSQDSLTPTMHQDFEDEGLVSYQNSADYEAVSMTYGEKNIDKRRYPTMRMILVRPKDANVSARDWLSQQAAAADPAWLDQYEYNSAVGSVELPRMDIKQKHDLIPSLQDMGINEAFSNATADFTPMTAARAGGLYISKVSHDVVFKTDEEGSEAAAVTTAVMTLECVAIPPAPINVKLDRSFVFALQDVRTGTVLFVGAVNKPNGDMKKAAKPAAPSAG